MLHVHCIRSAYLCHSLCDLVCLTVRLSVVTDAQDALQLHPVLPVCGGGLHVPHGHHHGVHWSLPHPQLRLLRQCPVPSGITEPGGKKNCRDYINGVGICCCVYKCPCELHIPVFSE